MNNRTSVVELACRVALEFKLTEVAVHNTINTFIASCKEELKDGRIVDFPNMLSLVPYSSEEGNRGTLAYICRKVADKTGVASHTAYGVMRRYLDICINDYLLRGRVVEFRGLVTLTPYYKNGVLSGVHAQSSETLSGIARVHTSKSLKGKLRCVEG